MNLRRIKSLFRAVSLLAFGLAGVSAQTQDSSGNGLLKGSYRFRHLAVTYVDASNDPTEITASYGTITFDGAGNYTVAGFTVDNTVSGGAAEPLQVTGTYMIGSNGAGYVSNPLYPADFYMYVYGAVAQGVYTGSSTESLPDPTSPQYMNDIFVAIPVGSAPTNASFTSPYQTGVLDFTGADFTGNTAGAIRNALFELTPDGKGGFGAITLSGQAANQNVVTITQTITGATYNFNSDASATLTIPAPSGTSVSNALFTGSKTIFQSADGNFILGWTTTGYDIFFGVKALAVAGTNALSTGLYFTAALEDIPSELGGPGADSFYGGTNNTGNSNGDSIVHQRFNTPAFLSEDYGSNDQIELNANGTVGNSANGYTDFFYGYEYVFGDGGQAFVSIGTGGYFSLQVGFHAPAFSGTGVYLNPIGVVNAASFQPVTASIAPGELLELTGTGLASTTVVTQGGQPFPTVGVDGVTVTINSIACPIYYVSPTQLAVIVPYAVAGNQTGLANVQVTNNGVKSNVVQVYLTDAAPGSFSQGASGIGFAAARHALTGQLITAANPIKDGELISLYLTGLGTVTPTISDGAVGPSTTLSWSDVYNAGNLTVNFNDYNTGSFPNPGTIQFAGLVPTLAGLYQINVQVPAGVLGSGDDVYVEFFTDAADMVQIQLPYGPGAATPPIRKAPAKSARMASLLARTQARKPAVRRVRGAPATAAVSGQ